MTTNGRSSPFRILGMTGVQSLLAGLLLAATLMASMTTLAQAETRTLKLYYTHTREKAEITFKKDGRYIQSGLNQLNHFLRDWRRNEPTKMDPRLFDVVWEAYRATGARDYIHVVSAYRSPATNSMLRKRSRGVADNSQHTLGKAMDFFIPGVKLAELRKAALRIQGGGVGYYPRSGSPFVHLDVGNVRHWPRMSRSELAAVFPKGNTLHVPTDGKPLPGYDTALAAYQKRKGAGIAIASAAPTKKRSGGLLSNLFGGGADEEEDNMDIVVGRDAPPQVTRRTPKPPVAIAAAPAPRPEAVLPGVAVAEAPAAPAPPAPVVALTPAEMIAELSIRDVPVPMFAPRAVDVAPVTVETVIASAADVPVPLARPDYVTPGAAVAAIASAAPVTSGEAAIEAILAKDKSGAAVPAPRARPGDPVELMALVPLPAPNRPVATAPKAERVALAGERPRSPRDLLREAGGDPVATLARGQVTTRKAPKPGPADARPDPRPVQVPVAMPSVSKVIGGDLHARVATRTPDGRAFAVNTLRAAPKAVYTTGFQAGPAPDAQRFSGKAVQFLSVAKFKTN